MIDKLINFTTEWGIYFEEKPYMTIAVWVIIISVIMFINLIIDVAQNKGVNNVRKLRKSHRSHKKT